jgi:hypothetical protein
VKLITHLHLMPKLRTMELNTEFSKRPHCAEIKSRIYITADGQSESLSWCQASIYDPRPIVLLHYLITF